jgi:hypothetical protein
MLLALLVWAMAQGPEVTLVDRNVEENGRLYRFVFEIKNARPVRVLVQVDAPTKPERDGNRVDALPVEVFAAVEGREGRQERSASGTPLLMFDPQSAPLVVVVEVRVGLAPGADAGRYQGRIGLRVVEERKK